MNAGLGQGGRDELTAEPVDSVLANELRALPKVKLHVHLEGCVSPSTFIELACRYDVPMPPTDREHVYDYHHMVSFMEVLKRLDSTIRNRDDAARITYEPLTDAARGSNVLFGRSTATRPRIRTWLTEALSWVVWTAPTTPSRRRGSSHG